MWMVEHRSERVWEGAAAFWTHTAALWQGRYTALLPGGPARMSRL